jgi:hypothetical protein
MSIRLQALPELAALWDQLAGLAAAEGLVIDVADFGGFRTAADTTEILYDRNLDYAAYAASARAAGVPPLPITGAWDDGRTRPIALYGQSKHDFGGARDYTVRPAPGMTADDAENRVDDLAESIGLRSGRSFGDPRHLELPYSLEELAQQWADFSSSSSSGLTALLVLLAVGVGTVTVLRYAHAVKAL